MVAVLLTVCKYTASDVILRLIDTCPRSKLSLALQKILREKVYSSVCVFFSTRVYQLPLNFWNETGILVWPNLSAGPH